MLYHFLLSLLFTSSSVEDFLLSCPVQRLSDYPLSQWLNGQRLDQCHRPSGPKQHQGEKETSHQVINSQDIKRCKWERCLGVMNSVELTQRQRTLDFILMVVRMCICFVRREVQHTYLLTSFSSRPRFLKEGPKPELPNLICVIQKDSSII